MNQFQENYSFKFGASHEHVWTPFVTYVIGDSCGAMSGQTSENNSLETDS